MPRQIIDAGHVAITGGNVAAVGAGVGPAAANVDDYRDYLILPGAIDGQVHSRSQKGQEDFIWSTRAAAAGGVTTIVDMPYDDGELICTGERLANKVRSAAEQARVDFALYATLNPTSDGAEVPDLVAALAPLSSPPSAPIPNAFRASRRTSSIATFRRSRQPA
jgi:allantoinase